MKEQTIMVNGFSKSHAMTGLRIGYAISPEETIDAMDKIHQYTMLCAANCTYGDGANNTVMTDAAGSFAVTQLWDIPGGAPPTYDEYNIVADRHGTGQGTYNAASDDIDSASVAGIVAPVPELASIILLSSGLVMLIVFVRLQSKKKEQKSIFDKLLVAMYF